jgi:hypothetical protein
MSAEEQQSLKQQSYNEAIRYMDNARETLQKARKEEYVYQDRKYVRTACGTAYNGVLIALDAYLSVKGISTTVKRKSIEHYRKHIAVLDKKLLVALNTVYNVLHLDGYYDGIQDARVVKAGFDVAYEIIDRIKPLTR